jgi:folate-dependent phosphoribosylglycinamide formyltransferase PurN
MVERASRQHCGGVRIAIQFVLMESRLRIVIFSGAGNSALLRLVRRIHREVPDAHVCGVLCERRPGKSVPKRALNFIRQLRERDFVAYAISRICAMAWRTTTAAGSLLLNLIHGGGPPRREQDREETQAFASLDCRLHVTADYHDADSLAFVRNLDADLGIVYGARILKPCLFTIPRLGSINIHKRRVPDYRGGGPVGLWELLDAQSNIGITVHEVTERLDAGAVLNAATIPIEPYDTLTSLALKAQVVGNDLLVRSVVEFRARRSDFQRAAGCGANVQVAKAPTN